jgi:hypothetical protein
MTKNYQYFSIPFHLVPPPQARAQPQPCTMWYATWSTTPPALQANTPAPMVIGVTEHELPEGARGLGVLDKDPPMPPPFMEDPDYEEKVEAWIAAGGDLRSADE